jgi:cellulose biosynthesis protein BcsQ
LRDLKQRGYTLAIIDTPGSDSDVVTEAIPLADLCLIPARPSQADIEAAYPTLKAIRSFDRKFAFFRRCTWRLKCVTQSDTVKVFRELR